MSDVEERLRRYGVAGPPRALREQIMRGVERPHRPTMGEWLPAFAAAALIVLFYVLGAGLRADVEKRIATPDDLKQVEQWGVPGNEVMP